MDNIWAPWRIKYVTKTKKTSCVFCKIGKQKCDKKNLVLWRTKYCFAILNLFPYNNGHAMIVPNRHIRSLEKLSDVELLDLSKNLIKLKKLLKKTLKPHGFNIGINLGKNSGAGIEEHLHIHIVPRWQGDTNFMPVTARTKVISQSLKELYEKCQKQL